jgi:hypothetical protein
MPEEQIDQRKMAQHLQRNHERNPNRRQRHLKHKEALPRYPQRVRQQILEEVRTQFCIDIASHHFFMIIIDYIVRYTLHVQDQEDFQSKSHPEGHFN